METITFPIKYKYDVAYLPTPRHKIERLLLRSGTIDISVPNVALSDAPVAFIVHQHDGDTAYHWYSEKLWRQMNAKDFSWDNSDEDTATLQHLVERLGNPCSQLNTRAQSTASQFNEKSIVLSTTEQEARQHLRDCAAEYLFICGQLYTTIGEPIYRIYTFGSSGDGTSLSVTNHIDNACREWLFRADDAERAVATAVDVALDHGDKNDVERIQQAGSNIEVLIPEAIQARLHHAPCGQQDYAEVTLRVKLNSDALSLYSIKAEDVAAGLELTGWISHADIGLKNTIECDSSLIEETTIVSAKAVPPPSKPKNDEEEAPCKP